MGCSNGKQNIMENAKIPADHKYTYSAKCICGAIEYTIDGPCMFNVLCHCKACSVSASSGPVHILGMKNEFWKVTKGEDLIQEFKGQFGKLVVAKCKDCSGSVYQHPEGADFKAAFPRMFRIEDGVNCMLPAELKPQAHLNYENRLFNYNDCLPKFVCFPPGPMCDNEGKVLSA